ncbi:MAG: lipopolysaccharide biosynthesis protein [Bacteroidaceae bacterium]|nr:lipopolysaccharide biosynthesis protein [Bacteroidaceae bacterium]
MKKESLVSSVIWKFLERSSVQVIGLIVQIVLARLIAPSQFGCLSIILVFYNFFDIFVQKGFSSALIRKKELSQHDKDTIFWISLIIAIVASIIIILSAPVIARFYEDLELMLPLRVMALALLISPIYCIYNALLVRGMAFRVIFIRSLLAALLSGTVGIIMALKGFGLWALVFQIIVRNVVLTMVMMIGTDYRIGLSFSKQSFRDVFSFGKNVLMTEVLLYIVKSLQPLLIGKYYSTKDLAYYDRGHTYPDVIMNAMNDTFFSTLLPYFSKIQDDDIAIQQKFTVTTKIMMFFCVPLFFLFAAVSNEFVLSIITDKWIEAVPFLIVFCLYETIFPFQISAKVVLYAKGESKTVFQTEIMKAILSVVLIVITVFLGPLYIATSLIVVRAFNIVMYFHSISKFIDIRPVLKESFKPFISSTLVFVLIFSCPFDIDSPFWMMIIKLISGCILYLGIEALIDKGFILQFVSGVPKRIIQK